jgi:hypothetical protein
MRTLPALCALTLALLCGCDGDDDTSTGERQSQTEASHATPKDKSTEASPATPNDESTETVATPSPSGSDGQKLAEADEMQLPSGVKRTVTGRDVFVSFRTPTGNSRCQFHSSQTEATQALRCDFASDVDPLPKPAGCPYDWGFSIGLQPRGKPKPLCVSDAVDPGNSVLAYGDTWSEGGIACTSRPTGLRCVNRRGHGFNLTRQRQDIF